MRNIKILSGFICLMLLLTGFPAIASTIEFKDYNCRLEVPENWKPVDTRVLQMSQSLKILVAFRTTDGAQGCFLGVTKKMPEAERLAAIRNFSAGIKNSATKDWRLVREGMVTPNKVPFYLVQFSKGRASAASYIVFADDIIYVLGFNCVGGLPTDSLEVTKLINGFRFISTPGIVLSGLDSVDYYSSNYRAGALAGKILGWALAILILLWVVRRLTRIR